MRPCDTVTVDVCLRYIRVIQEQYVFVYDVSVWYRNSTCLSMMRLWYRNSACLSMTCLCDTGTVRVCLRRVCVIQEQYVFVYDASVIQEQYLFVYDVSVWYRNSTCFCMMLCLKPLLSETLPFLAQSTCNDTLKSNGKTPPLESLSVRRNLRYFCLNVIANCWWQLWHVVQLIYLKTYLCNTCRICNTDFDIHWLELIKGNKV